MWTGSAQCRDTEGPRCQVKLPLDEERGCRTQKEGLGALLVCCSWTAARFLSSTCLNTSEAVARERSTHSASVKPWGPLPAPENKYRNNINKYCLSTQGRPPQSDLFPESSAPHPSHCDGELWGPACPSTQLPSLAPKLQWELPQLVPMHVYGTHGCAQHYVRHCSHTR